MVKGMRDWFSDEELEDCSRCGEHSALVSPTGFIICTECGIVGVRAEVAAHGTPAPDDE